MTWVHCATTDSYFLSEWLAHQYCLRHTNSYWNYLSYRTQAPNHKHIAIIKRFIPISYVSILPCLSNWKLLVGGGGRGLCPTHLSLYGSEQYLTRCSISKIKWWPKNSIHHHVCPSDQVPFHQPLSNIFSPSTFWCEHINLFLTPPSFFLALY